MSNYISCLYEKSYNDYFQCIREDVNSKNSFKGASYFIKTDSGIEPIQPNLIFYTIYGDTILRSLSGLGYIYLPENSYLRDTILRYRWPRSTRKFISCSIIKYGK
jgi:hypothetical protein